MVSDNATAFTGEEFAKFLSENGIRHVRTPPYHPASNGLVERAVQTFKEGLKRLKSGSLNTRFLLRYRITPHSATGSSPAEMMMGRKLRTHLDLLQPNVSGRVQQYMDRQKQAQQAHDEHAAQRQFGVNDGVYARNYGRGPLRLSGFVVGTEGSAMYKIRLDDGHRHADQLRSRTVTHETPVITGDETPLELPSVGSESSTGAAGEERELSEQSHQHQEQTVCQMTQWHKRLKRLV